MSVIIRLQGLPLTASSGDIRNFFSGLRIPDGAVNIVGGDDGDAFIGFATDEDARQAMRKNEGLIHNTEVRLFLSSRTEMKEVIDNARSAPPPPPKPPSIPPRFGSVIHSPRNEREEPQIFSSREDQSRFGRDAPSQYGRNGPSFGRDESQRYGRESSQTSSFPLHATFPTGTTQSFGDTRFDERKGTGQYPKDRPSFDNIVQAPNYGSEKIDQRKSEQNEVRAEPWINRDRDFLGNIRHQNGDRGYMHPFSAIRQEDGERRNPNQDVFGNGRIDGDERREVKNKEESWRGENSLSFQRFPPPLAANVSSAKEEDTVSFFGRGPLPPKRPLLPPPIVPIQSAIPSSHSIISPPIVQTQKEEVFVELTRLPPDLIRPSILEEFLSPSTPLTLSSVKVVYSPEGIHLQSLVRFTSALDAFNALKKDGEQGVKIRPSTKEAFDSARDGPPTPSSLDPLHPLINTFTPTMPMGALPPPPVQRLNLFTMPLIKPNENMMGHNIRGRDGIEMGRGEFRRRDDSPSRGRREERRRSYEIRLIVSISDTLTGQKDESMSNSPRSKKPRGDRICVYISNLPFRVKESEIRRLLGSGLNPYAIKKIFNEDNAPSDVWIMEFSSEAEAIETVRRRMEAGGRLARLKIIDEPEADRLLRQKFKSPPRREKVGEQRDSFDEKVRMQQEAIEMEKARMNGSSDLSSAETALAGAFSGPVFSTNRGFMRGGRGGGRGMRGEMRGINNGGTRGRRGGLMNVMGRGDGLDRNCLLISNMPHLGSPQVLLEHLRIMPSQFVRVDQIAPDAAIIELREEMYAIGVAENASGESFPFLLSKKLIVAAMSRRQIEDEFNLRGGEINNTKVKQGGYHPGIDPEMIRSIGGEGCILICHGFPRDLTIDEVKSFFEGYPMIESSVRMRMEGGEGTGECMVAMSDSHSLRRAVQALNGTLFRGAHIVVQSL